MRKNKIETKKHMQLAVYNSLFITKKYWMTSSRESGRNREIKYLAELTSFVHDN